MKVLALPLTLALIACASSEEKPTPAEPASMDGTWGETTLTCDGEPNPRIPQLTLEVAGNTGSFSLGFGPECAVSVPESYAFKGNIVSITPLSVSCEPNAGCGAVFGGADCLPGPPPPTDFEYAVSGDTLTLKKTSGGPPADNCPSGAVELYTMKRQ